MEHQKPSQLQLLLLRGLLLLLRGRPDAPGRHGKQQGGRTGQPQGGSSEDSSRHQRW
jgi:hypothetical protein